MKPSARVEEAIENHSDDSLRIAYGIEKIVEILDELHERIEKLEDRQDQKG